jgi:hypothetical protein
VRLLSLLLLYLVLPLFQAYLLPEMPFEQRVG